MAVGDQIRFYRKQRGWTQSELASRCGYFNEEGEPAQSRISNYENKIRTNYDEIELRNIAKALGIEVGDLFSDTGIDTNALIKDVVSDVLKAFNLTNPAFFSKPSNKYSIDDRTADFVSAYKAAHNSWIEISADIQPNSTKAKKQKVK